MPAEDDFSESLAKLIAGGFIGTLFGAALARNREEGAFIGLLLGAAAAATLEAYENALKTGRPVLVAENGKLYKIMPDGSKVFMRDLPRSPDVSKERITL